VFLAFDNHNRPEKVVVEAVRCLVNMIFKSSSLRISFLKESLHLKVADKLKVISPDNYDHLFPLLRLLFLAIRPVEKNESHREIAFKGYFPDIFNILKYQVELPEFPSQKTLSLTRECLQNMFNITIDMGPLGKGNMNYEEIVPNFEEVITFLLRIFNTRYEDPIFYDVKICCMNCFINIPVKFMRILVVLGDPQTTLKTLCDILEHEIREVGDDSKNIAMVLMVSQLLLSRAPEARPYFLLRLFPNRDLDKEAEDSTPDKVNMDVLHKDADTLGNRLVKYMTSFNQTLKFSASELLFSLVGEDATKLIRLCGFGNSAGLLAMRNLFGMGKHLNKEN